MIFKTSAKSLRVCVVTVPYSVSQTGLKFMEILLSQSLKCGVPGVNTRTQLDAHVFM